MLERPPGGTTIRRPAGLMGTSSGVGGPGYQLKERKMRKKGLVHKQIEILRKK